MLFSRKKQDYSLPPPWCDKIALRHSLRARRLSLTVDLKQRRIVLVLPRRFSPLAADHFLLQNRAWIERHSANLPQAETFSAGCDIPFRGTLYRLCPFPDARRRGTPEISAGRIFIPGDPAHFARRALDFLIEEARRVLTARTHEKAAVLNKTVRAIRLGDPRTRWGSCHPDGRISYSWRLILAPDAVLDYVVAHEVAHLLHRGHGPAFWDCCDRLTGAMNESRAWLKKNGRDLQIYNK